MYIQGEYATLAVHVEEGRSAAAGKAAHRPFNNPPLSEQLFYDEGDGTSLQPGDAGQIGTRDGLPGANLIEDEVAVDLARYLVRRTYPVGEREAGCWRFGTALRLDWHVRRPI